MEFIETVVFRRKVKDLLSDEQLRRLQINLMLFPDAGSIIPGSGGIRKLRWARKGRGKSGGLRIIYYWMSEDHKIYLITLYSKAYKNDLSFEEIKYFKMLIEKEIL